ncbi:MAG: YbbR-like domain-containing protein [candidate division Zixibacteria bacterium]|nr:YbbR-like domain-containing protein [candidate division Zixibacteria bacterium]
MLKIFDNLWAKFFSLLIGVLIWFHVATEKSYNYDIRLPITKVDIKEGLILTRPFTDTVTAGVTAIGKQLLREKWQAQGVRLSAVGYPAGQHTVALTPSNVTLVSTAGGVHIHDIISPTSVALDIDQQYVAFLPVEPALDVTADVGFAVARQIDVSPDTVTVVGPRSVIKTLKSVATQSYVIKGLRTGTTIKLPLAHPENSNLRITPDSATLSIRVVPVKTRSYDNLQVIVFNAPAGSSVVTSPPLVRVDLAGPPEDIDLLNRNAITVSVDYRHQSADHKAQLKVDCPSSFRVARLPIDSVRIIEER